MVADRSERGIGLTIILRLFGIPVENGLPLKELLTVRLLLALLPTRYARSSYRLD